jgi:diamine N-acetyltransferase
MPQVTLRRLAGPDHARVMGVRPHPEQEHLVASVEVSLAEVEATDALTAFAVFDRSQLGLPEPDQPPVGFAVTEVVASVGFILRVLIDADHQRAGYGRAAMTELVRRLRLLPDVELIATSHRADNLAMARLCADLGFEAWDTPFTPPSGEVYLCLRPEVADRSSACE